MAKHIYIHIPFCASKCPYCDFYSEAGRSESCVASYFDALAKEITLVEDDSEIETIYIGGGTPSFVPAKYIVDLVGLIRSHFNVSPSAEITIEVNPSSVTYDKAAAYLSAGINRVSVGVQSLHDEHLKTLERLHDSEKALMCINMLREAGFDNISADLIIAVPGQTLDDVLADLSVLAKAGVTHISTYSLTIERGTPYWKMYSDTIEDLVPPELERRMYHSLRAALKEHGYIPYEISNSCLPGFESRHNASYWDGDEYYGFGPGSHGYVDSRRYMHVNSIDGYLYDPLETETEEELDDEAKMREYPFLRLRTTSGIDLIEFKRKYGYDFMEIYSKEVLKNVEEGLLEVSEGHVRLTEKGLDWCNKVAEDFL